MKLRYCTSIIESLQEWKRPRQILRPLIQSRELRFGTLRRERARSREAAEEFSPGRKPWERSQWRFSPERAEYFSPNIIRIGLCRPFRAHPIMYVFPGAYALG